MMNNLLRCRSTTIVVVMFMVAFWSFCSDWLLTSAYFNQQQQGSDVTLNHPVGQEELDMLKRKIIEKKGKTLTSIDSVLPENVSGIFDEDPFRNFRKELSWIPNRTLIPWEQLNRTAPCIITKNALNGKKQRTPSRRGILYIKPEKAASSTIAGVTARIAHKLFDLSNTSKIVSRQGINVTTPACQLRLTHGWSDNRHNPRTLTSRIRNESFLFTFLRNPGRRALSSFYYFGVDGKNITGKEVEPNATEVLDFLKTNVNGQFEKCLDKEQKRRYSGNWTRREMFTLQVQTIVDELDFIGIVERMDESLVALQLLLGSGLRPSDVLYFSAKESNTFMDRKRVGKCYFIYKHEVLPPVKSYLESNEYREANYGDELLYRVANSNLDRFIDFVGRDTFVKSLREFRNAKEKVEKACLRVGKCDTKGTFIPLPQRSKCYYADYGCGYECADAIFDDGYIGAKV